MNADLMFSSKSEEWATPQDLFDCLNKVFEFWLDVCATKENAKCQHFYTREDDGLKQEWYGTCWMNPPYGRTIGRWVEKAYQSARQNRATVVCLLPARTDTKWWQDFCSQGEVFFVRGRLRFGGSKAGAPFPSAIVVFRPSVMDAFSRQEVHPC